jgi:predicted glycosyltransferase/MoaA/NifB/PqqE/SkfB family radical SAM enzyme
VALALQKMPTILIHVQNSCGTGHLVMELLLADRLAEEHTVYVAYGGPAIGRSSRAFIIQLPELHDTADGIGSGRHSLAYAMKARNAMLMDLFSKSQPDCVIIEHYPFGRPRYRYEILALIELAKQHDVRLISSFRGIVGRRLDSGELSQLNADIADFDAVLVHTDPAIIKLEDEIDCRGFRDKLVYTGFLAPKMSVSSKKNGTMLQCGSGRSSREIIRAVSQATLPSHIRAYPGLYGDMKYADGIKIEDYVPGILDAISGSALIISTAGYNSAVESMLTDAPTVLIPISQEQERMAGSLEARGLATMVRLTDLDAGSLGAAAKAARPKHHSIRLDGADTAAKYISNLPARLTITDSNYRKVFERLYSGEFCPAKLELVYNGGQDISCVGYPQAFYQEVAEGIHTFMHWAKERGIEVVPSKRSPVIRYLSSFEPKPAKLLRRTREENRAQGDAELKEGAIALTTYPRTLYVELTRNCNCRCMMCPRSFLKEYETDDPKRDMDKALFRRIADELFPMAEEVDLRGFGESTILPDFDDYLDYALRFDPQYILVTNLTARKDSMWRKLVKNRFILGMSVDGGTRATYEMIRRGARWEDLCHNLALLQEERQKVDSPSHNFLMVCVQKANIFELQPIIDLASRYGLSEVELNPVGKPEFSISSLPQEKVRGSLEQLFVHAKKLGVKITMSGSLGLPDTEKELHQELQSGCPRPWSYAYITYDGKLGPCNHRFNPPLVFGDLTKQSFEDVWNDFAFQFFRSTISTEHRFGKCSWCYENRYY